jgi:hypothetical protein
MPNYLLRRGRAADCFFAMSSAPASTGGSFVNTRDAPMSSRAICVSKLSAISFPLTTCSRGQPLQESQPPESE